MKHLGMIGRLAAATALSAMLSSTVVQAAEKLDMVVFGPPSLGAFLPPIIKAKGFDAKHDLDVNFQQRPPDAYAAQFNSGEFKIGGSAALLTVGLAEARGVKVTYLFNLFDYWGGVVTSRPEIKTLKDLEGQQMAAATGTTNFKMFNWLAQQQGVDTSKLSIVNTAPPGLVGYAVADRAATVQLWEPAYTSLLGKKPDIRLIELNIREVWEKEAGSAHIPYLGVAAHTDWVEANPETVANLYAAYAEAAEWVAANPDEAAKIIAGKQSADYQEALAGLIRNNDRLGLNVQWANDMRDEIGKVYEAGMAIDYLPGKPTDATIYAGSSK